MSNTTTRRTGMLRLSQAEMLSEWKTRKGFLEGLRECSAERDDGVDTDQLLRREIDGWYARLLSEAPVELLPIEDIAEECGLAVDSRLAATITLPERCVRPVELKMAGWAAPATEFFKPDSETARRQRCDWLRGGPERPVCVAGAGQLTAYSVASAGEAAIETLRAVCYPSGGNYVFAEGAWALFPEYFTPY